MKPLSVSRAPAGTDPLRFSGLIHAPRTARLTRALLHPFMHRRIVEVDRQRHDSGRPSGHGIIRSITRHNPQTKENAVNDPKPTLMTIEER